MWSFCATACFVATIGFGMHRSVNTDDTHAGQERMGEHPFGFDSFDPLLFGLMVVVFHSFSQSHAV
jgi:hypothetical protein